MLGYYAHSLALVADAFHMLNDVLSLCVGLWAVRVATNRSSTSEYTYGWARAELLGGLVNGVFLIALCVTIFLDAIGRFFEPQEVSNPKLVLIVGGVGLAFNILGLFVFHQHSHDHGDHDHDHDHGHETDPVDAAENGHAHKHSSSVTFHEDSHGHGHGHGHSHNSSPVRVRTGSVSSRRNRSYSTIDDLPTHPSYVRAGILAAARAEGPDLESDDTDDDDTVEDEDVQTGKANATESTSLLSKTNGHSHSHSHSHSHAHSHDHNSNSIVNHAAHKHAQPKKKSSSGGHGHNHADMNLRGMFLHVLGDALGNVGVMASALVIWLTTSPYRFYFDPAISLFITLIILKSAIPLCRDTARPLLQAVPEHISVDDITQDIASIPGVRSCHHVHVWALTPQKLVATLDVEVGFGFGPGADASKLGGRERWMALAREIKRCLHGHGIHSSTIQPEFCVDHSAEEHRLAAQGKGGDGAVAAGDGSGRTSEGVQIRSKGDHDGCGDGTCLLDCKDGCKTGKECCGPVAISRDEGQAGDHHGHGH